MTEIVLATRNSDKILEITHILQDLPVTLKSHIDYPEIYDVVEDGDTFEANALKKATTFYRETGLIALADDSGLEVDALNGDPGIFSARYAGEDVTYEDNYRKLLHELEGIPLNDRKARFVCTIAIVTKNDVYFFASGTLEGLITLEPKGEYGFGYDPVFYLPEYDKTVAELAPDIKNKISHRAQALQKAKEIIIKNILSGTT
ncbi:XTP/dITP diphosphatase [bacterium]|nr:XTP/dITP diphosphatase [bacterium]